MSDTLGSSNLYKVCLIGDSGVGKTSIFNCARGRDFSTTPRAETDSCRLPFVIKDEDENKDINVSIDLWDTAGQERWGSLTESYYRDAKAVIIVFAVDSHESFKSVYRDIKHIKDKDFSPNAIYFLVGNKIDLKSDEVSNVQIDDCQKCHPGIFSTYLRTSAKKKKTVDELFSVVAQTLVSKHVKPVQKGNMFQPIYDPPKKTGCC